MFHHRVVNGDDRDEIGRRLDAAGQRSQIDRMRLDTVEKSQPAARLAQTDRDRPTPPCRAAQSEFESVDCSLACFYCPNLAIKAATRAGGQRLTINSPGGFDIDAVAGPEHDLPPPAGRATLTLPSTTKTEVFATSGIDGPFGAAHRRDRLRRHHVEAIAAGLLRHLDQQGLVAEFDGIDVAVAVAIPEFELCAVLGHDRDRRRRIAASAFRRAVGFDVQPKFAGWAAADPASRQRLANAIQPARASLVMATSPSGYGERWRTGMIRNRITH